MTETFKHRYKFSCWVKVLSTPTLVRRPWWNLFGRDHIEPVEQWQLVSIQLDNSPPVSLEELGRFAAQIYRRPILAPQLELLEGPDHPSRPASAPCPFTHVPGNCR